MKNFTCAALTGVCFSIAFLSSCTKDELEDPGKKKPKKTSICDVAVFSQQYAGGESTPIYSKTYDLSGRVLSRLDVGLFSGGGIWKTVHLNLTYNANKIYFISADNSADTGLVVDIDNAGRPLHVVAGQIIDDGFGPQDFSYQDGRIHEINIDNNWMRIWFRYDSHGNNTQIVTDSVDGLARIDQVYEYDITKKTKRHFYLDEARGFSFNVLTILQAAGFFPELDPVHARTRTTVHWGGYLAYDFMNIDQKYDKDGRLLQYKTARPGSKTPNATYTLSYNCVRSTGNDELLTAAY
jgi:hypothetical protein